MNYVGRGLHEFFPGGGRAAGLLLCVCGAWALASAQTAPAPMPVAPPVRSAADFSAGATSPAIPSAERQAPLAPPPTDVAPTVTAEQSAQVGLAALQSGLPAQAEPLLLKALSAADLPVARRDEINLGLASVRLALGRDAEARAALYDVAGKNSPAFFLRLSLLEARAGLWLDASNHLLSVEPASLSSADRPWYFFTQSLLADHMGQMEAANKAREQARDAATGTLQQAQFEAAFQRGLILSEEATPARELTLRQSADKYRGQREGVKFGLLRAVVLEKLNRHAEALAVAQDLWRSWSLEDDTRDEIRLLLGLLDPDSYNSMQRLEEIISGRRDRLSMERALALLQNNKAFVSDPKEQQAFFDELINDAQKHPLLDQLYLLRAQLALSQNQVKAANDNAQQLLQQFPGSPSRQAALGLLAYIAWMSEPKQYRTAADYVNQLRTDLPEGPERARLSALQADLYYLNGDFRNAAELYAGLLTDPMPPAPRGVLLFRAVQSQLRAGHPEAALKNLDDTAGRADVEPLDRWRAWWSVLSTLRDLGRDTEALDRLDQLLTPGANEPPADLALRLRWLSAQLAVSVRQPSALARANAFQAALDALPPGDAAANDELRASALLLRGQAALLAGNKDDYTRLFEKLRADFPKSNAAAQSIFDEASQEAVAGNFAKAQTMMKDLVQRFPQSDFAPLALYYAALNAATRNQNEDALALLALLRSNYKDSPLVYDALRLAGDLERKRNNVKDALAAYDVLLANWPNHPMRDRVAMARADCLVALAGQDKGRRAAAIDALENLVASTSLPVDARVEAGFKLGFLLQSGTAAERENAEVTYWSVIAPLRDDPAYGADLGQQGEGRYWMGRCIFYLANLYEQENKLNEAQSLYRLVIERGLDEFAPMAKMRLQKPPNAPDAPASPVPSATPAAAATPGV